MTVYESRTHQLADGVMAAVESVVNTLVLQIRVPTVCAKCGAEREHLTQAEAGRMFGRAKVRCGRGDCGGLLKVATLDRVGGGR